MALQVSYGDLAGEKQTVGGGYVGRSRERQGERTFWASSETPWSQRGHPFASQLTPVYTGVFFASTHNCKTPSRISFSSSMTTTSALLLFKSRSLECRNVFQAHPNRQLHHLSQPVLQHLTRSPSLPDRSGHTPSFLGGILPCSPLPGILASLHEVKSSLQEATLCKIREGRRRQRSQGQGFGDSAQCQQGKVACLHFGEAFGQRMTEALNCSTGEGGGVSAGGENPFIHYRNQ